MKEGRRKGEGRGLTDSKSRKVQNARLKEETHIILL